MILSHFIRRLSFCLCLGVLAPAGTCVADTSAGYLNHKNLTRELRALSRRAREFIRLHELAESAQGREVWLAEAGFGDADDRESRPAMLVMAGVEGDDLTGSASAWHWLRQLAEGVRAGDEDARALLESTTLYVVPRLNPDALETYFGEPRFATLTDFEPADDDHDGLTDEDGGEDLNGDGLISWMRVEDPEGRYLLDRTDPRVMVEADPLKGEKGAWKLLLEGRDDDGDEAWNEDGPGGVNFNRNYPYNYRYFGKDAGRHPVSRPETRALADFVVEHANIGIVFTFGRADNLLKAPKGESNPKRPPTAMHEKDASFVRELGEAWRKALGLDKELSGNEEPGTFSDWMYYHRGRLSLAARPWSPELALALARALEKERETGEKPPEKEEGENPEAKPEENAGDSDQPREERADDDVDAGEAGQEAEVEPDKRSQDERDLLQWAEKHAPQMFPAWREYDHPDFPDQKVEIGGWAPFAKSVAPPNALTNLVSRHAAFLTELAGRLPRVRVRRVEVKALGKSVYDITAQVENTGYLPLALAQGETTREVFPARVTLEVDENLILGGTKRVLVDNLAGSGGMEEVRWICRLPDTDRVDMSVVSMLGGRLRHAIALQKNEDHE